MNDPIEILKRIALCEVPDRALTLDDELCQMRIEALHYLQDHNVIRLRPEVLEAIEEDEESYKSGITDKEEKEEKIVALVHKSNNIDTSEICEALGLDLLEVSIICGKLVHEKRISMVVNND